jgi:ABC-type bacteriocin/lantibiotic exporter with double-glycine peptidase domain
MPQSPLPELPVTQKVAKVVASDALNKVEGLQTSRADLAAICRYAALYQAPESLILEYRATQARRRERLTSGDALAALEAMGLRAAIFQGDLKDLENMNRPVLAIARSDAYLLVLLVERRLVLLQAGKALHPLSVKRLDFNRAWTQSWIGITGLIAADINGSKT